jgi:hypothetical protein
MADIRKWSYDNFLDVAKFTYPCLFFKRIYENFLLKFSSNCDLWQILRPDLESA